MFPGCSIQVGCAVGSVTIFGGAPRAARRVGSQRDPKARSRKRQEIQKRIAALEKEIAGLEAKEKELAAELEKPESYAGGRAMQINRELMHIHDRLPVATAEWEAAGTELAEFEAL